MTRPELGLRPFTWLLVALAIAVACGPRPPATTREAAPRVVENADLGLAVRPVPAGFEVAENAGSRLVFDAVADGVPGSLAITVGAPVPAGVNLAETAKQFGAAAAAVPAGKFFGGNELVTPLGTAYTVRVLVDGGTVEEREVFLLHPGDRDRLVTLALRYPPGDANAARARMQQVIDLLGALQAFASVPPRPS